MSDKDKHMALYSSSDIEKYLSGELSDPEMHALERAALDDPFLADALEGMAVHRGLPGHPVFEQDMAALHKRLEEKVSSRKKDRGLLLPLGMRYAAAVILLLGLGVTAYYTLFSRKMKAYPLSEAPVKVVSPDQAVTPPPATSSIPAASGPDSTKLVPGNGAIVQSDREAPLKKAADNAQKESKAEDTVDTRVASNYLTIRPGNRDAFPNLAKQPGAPVYSNTTKNANVYDINTSPPKSFLTDSPAFYRDSLAYTLKKIGSGTQMQNSTESYYKNDQLVLRGKVIDPQNIPLAGVTLTLKGNRSFITTTDKDGNFTFTLPKKDSSSRVLVNYIGYEQSYATLDTDDKRGNIIQLKPQSHSLNEVVVVGYGTKRREFTRSDINSIPRPLSQTAVPAEGWPAYTNYLELNKRSPELDSTIRGYESISFIVNKKGELSSFKVEQSLSPAHDSLTIRLIKQGPSWKLLSGKKERARVILTW